jgi:hypothetical protein
MPRNILSLLPILLLALAALWLRADDAPPDPNSDDTDEPQEVALEEVAGFRVDVNYFDERVFGGKGPEAVQARRDRLDLVLRRKLETVDWACELTRAQSQKLRLAGQGDIERVMTRVEECRQRLESMVDAGQAREDASKHYEVVRSASESLESSPFKEGSRFVKTLNRIATPEQLMRYKAIQSINRVGGRLKKRFGGPDELKEIDLNVTRFGDDGLAQVAHLRSVQRLNLDTTRVTDEGLVHLRGLADLENLNLGSTQITDAGLVNLQGLTKLQVLNLRSTQTTDDGLIPLARLAALRNLRLSETRITDAGLKHLKDLKDLEVLQLGATAISDAGLVELTGLVHLNELGLLDTRVCDAGLANLSGLSTLRVLDLRNTQVTDAGLGHLYALKDLTELYLYGTDVSDAGAAEIREKMPRVKVYR